ncbi:VPS10 domain-containing protein [Ascidiimonas sp. W6]|uniref:VPS10 domain-containing protein n=1 Tax=Ascidiimonas meishanensis TaxID=3128903 RepID=UPI0030EFA169
MRKYILLGFAMCLFMTTSAQQPASSQEAIKSSIEKTKQLRANSIVKNIPFDNIGPTVMSGRVVDLDVNPDNPTEFYVAYASGGLWHTKNNGTSFTPILDSAPTQNIGDIAVDWSTRTIWVGGGENNASRSSYAGIGILKSTNNGKTWDYVGLPDSHHTGRILLNPSNSDEVVIGITGHLYSPNKQRGIYKTSDGGKTWKQTLFINENTGIIDLAFAPDNFNIQYAAAWQKDRKAWNFTGNGEHSGIYKSTDGGSSWQLISTKDSGFPTGNGLGRIGLAVYDENTVYAVHDSQYLRKKSEEKKESETLSKEDFKSMTLDAFLKLDDKKLNTYLKLNGFQEKYRADNVKQMVRSGTVQPADLAKYLENANAMLFDTPVVGAEIYRSDDGGKNWKKTHEGYIDDLFYSYGYYFAQIEVDLTNKEHIYTAGVPIIKSKDGGKTFTSINRENVHADHHAIWLNPKMPGHIINGNDGGVNISYDDGETWIKNNSPSVGQFYAINVDHQEPYHVYGGLQDNGVWMGPHDAEQNSRWHQTGQYPWKSIMGGDGMQIQIDSRDPNIVYTGFQFGNYYRINLAEDTSEYIQPKHELGESPYRFNWQTPILLSPHNQDILYLGGNKLHRSMNQGEDWVPISKDLTSGGKKGNVAYGTLTTIDESPFQFGLLYTGSDDGLVHMSKDGGANWKLISSTFPKDLWVSRVVASKHKKDRVYVTLNGYRWDDFNAYVYMSNDNGVTWKSISNNLPNVPVNVIIEDSENENLLFIGTDNGVYVSFDTGSNWQAFHKGIPYVAVHDLKIQAKAKDLLVGTHGRSIYKTNIEPLQLFTDQIKDKVLHIFNIPSIRKTGRWGSTWSKWLKAYKPSINFQMYSSTAGEYKVEIMSSKGILMHTFDFTADAGFNYVPYDITVSEKGRKSFLKKHKNEELSKAANGDYFLPKGSYKVVISGNGTQKTAKFDVN